VVIMLFSGHGYSGEHAAFYLLPSDSQPWKENWLSPSAEGLQRTISAQDLSSWLRTVNASDIVLIIDACHSAASIEAEGFKPGPLGSRGLGQLAYDKRMRVLAASQSDQAARELGGQIAEGVLTYALAHDGLQAGKAVADDGTITLSSWLNYPVQRVPQIIQDIHDGVLDDYGIKNPRSTVPVADVGGAQREGATQVPVLFDYTDRQHGAITLEQKK
jgi:hypothetical protein